MACVDPKLGWISKKRDENGKYGLTFQMPINEEAWRYMPIACGNCIGCKMDYSQMWTARITHEASSWKNNWFLTLTYNDLNLPIARTINKETGEYVETPTLRHRDIQLFLKRMRKKYGEMRYFIAGEYGPRGGRPHYHAAIFNAPVIEDIEEHGKTKQGGILWTSKEIEKIWGMGYITIGELTANSAGYIARYMLKKQKGEKKEYYEKVGIKPPYTRASTKPGIGREYYEENKEIIYRQDCVYILNPNGKNRKTKTPSYYDKLLNAENPEKIIAIKDNRINRAIIANKNKTDMFSKKYREIKRQQQIELEANAKKLPRPIEG